MFLNFIIFFLCHPKFQQNGFPEHSYGGNSKKYFLIAHLKIVLKLFVNNFNTHQEFSKKRQELKNIY